MVRKPAAGPAAGPVGAADSRSRFYRRRGKRLLDLALTTAALPLVVPLALLVALAVRLVMGRPVLFHQQRPGLYERPFTLIKFRTLEPGRPAPGVTDIERSSSFGRFLRRTSLDELPELWNVLRGEMSLVGPRPLLMKYLSRYGPRERRRHEVRPGLTGWAQVHGRNRTTWEERFALDLWYVENCSLALDCRILLATALELVRDDGGLERGSQLGEYPGPAAGPGGAGDD